MREPPALLVEVMYRQDPDAAFRTLYSATQAGDTDETQDAHLAVLHKLIVDHMAEQTNYVEPLDDQTQQTLAKLTRSKRWWARLYVAELMCRFEPYRQQVLLKSMLRDPHPLVRSLAQKVAKMPSERAVTRPTTEAAHRPDGSN